MVRGIDHCLRCGRQLRASRLPFLGDCCAKRVTPAQLEAMRVYAEQAADPFHIPEPRPLSLVGRRNNADARAAVTPGAARLCRHDNQVGRCGDCRREADPARAAERILREVCAQPYRERRAERVAVWAARRAAGVPAPAPPPRPAPRPRRRTRPRPVTAGAPRPAAAAEQLELI